MKKQLRDREQPALDFGFMLDGPLFELVEGVEGARPIWEKVAVDSFEETKGN
jgi:hypothetical protein